MNNIRLSPLVTFSLPATLTEGRDFAGSCVHWCQCQRIVRNVQVNSASSNLSSLLLSLSFLETNNSYLPFWK